MTHNVKPAPVSAVHVLVVDLSSTYLDSAVVSRVVVAASAASPPSGNCLAVYQLIALH